LKAELSTIEGRVELTYNYELVERDGNVVSQPHWGRT